MHFHTVCLFKMRPTWAPCEYCKCPWDFLLCSELLWMLSPPPSSVAQWRRTIPCNAITQPPPAVWMNVCQWLKVSIHRLDSFIQNVCVCSKDRRHLMLICESLSQKFGIILYGVSRWDQQNQRCLLYFWLLHGVRFHKLQLFYWFSC